MAGDTTARLSGKKRRIRGVVIALVVLAILAGWWHFTRPREMRLVGVQELKLPVLPQNYSYSFKTNRDYILATSSLPAITVMQWDGTVRWHILPPKPFLSARYWPRAKKIETAISPNGRFCAVADAQGTTQRVLVWDEGRLTTSISLPLPIRLQRGWNKPILVQPIALDSGQVFLWSPIDPIGRIALVEGGRIRAQGKLPKVAGEFSCGITADGHTLIVGTSTRFSFYRITIENNSICLTPTYTAKESSFRCYVTIDGLLITDNGAIYNAHGQVSGPTGWELTSVGGRDPTSSSVIIQYHYDSSIDIRYMRILDPRTGGTWIPGKRHSSLFSQITPEGQYALIDEQPNRITAIVRLWVVQQHYNSLPDGLFYRFFTVPLSIYQRPGRLCARLPIIEHPSFTRIKNSQTGQWVDLWDVALSRNGHTVYCLIRDHRDEGHWQIMSYTW